MFTKVSLIIFCEISSYLYNPFDWESLSRFLRILSKLPLKWSNSSHLLDWIYFEKSWSLSFKLDLMVWTDFCFKETTNHIFGYQNMQIIKFVSHSFHQSKLCRTGSTLCNYSFSTLRHSYLVNNQKAKLSKRFWNSIHFGYLHMW